MNEYAEDNALRQKAIGDPEHWILFARHLDSDGDGTGTKNMATTADAYYIKPGSTEVFVIDEVVITASDNAAIDPDGFVSIAALSNGCLFAIDRYFGEDEEYTPKDLTDGVAITSNAELMKYGDVHFSGDVGSCFMSLHAKLSTPLKIDGTKGEILRFETQDSLAGLISFYVVVYGRMYQNTCV